MPEQDENGTDGTEDGTKDNTQTDDAAQDNTQTDAAQPEESTQDNTQSENGEQKKSEPLAKETVDAWLATFRSNPQVLNDTDGNTGITGTERRNRTGSSTVASLMTR